MGVGSSSAFQSQKTKAFKPYFKNRMHARSVTFVQGSLGYGWMRYLIRQHRLACSSSQIRIQSMGGIRNI